MPFEIKQPASEPTRASWTCPVCDYDLASRPVGSPCPECGTPIAQRIDDTLAYAPLPYRARLLWGVRLTWASLLVPPLIFLSGKVRTDASTVTCMALALLCGIVWYIGVWLLTTRRPPHSSRDTRDAWTLLRVSARILAAGWPVMSVMVIVNGSGAIPGVALYTTYAAAAMVLALILLIASLAAFPVVLEYAARIVHWAGATVLAKHVHTMALIHAIILGAFGATIVLVLLISPGLAVCMTMLQAAAWLIAGILSIFMYGSVHVVIARSRRAAHASRAPSARSIAR